MGASDSNTSETNDTASPSGDHVADLSSLSSSLRANQSDSPERLALLEKLSTQFDTGQYQPDLSEVSKKIVSDAIVDGTEE
jgi:anti-sigma28 factor (negative regulator of flagellin synthesis)